MTASYDPYGRAVLRSPIQANTTFAQKGRKPRQHGVFLIRFQATATQVPQGLSTLTFAVKSIDRPKVQMKTEELNQYNKKRHVFTGFNYEPIRVQFYDSADGAAQNLWTCYARYYFGDFNAMTSAGRVPTAVAYDVTLPEFFGSPLGFTAKNGGAANPDAQFFFNLISIFHFYDGYCDQYDLIHPRIKSYDPDDLDYESSAISMISMTLVFENLQYYQGVPVADAQFEEFKGNFNGNPLPITYPIGQNPITNPLNNTASGDNSDLQFSASPPANFYQGFRLGGGATSGGSLGIFGNFSFGPSGLNASLTASLGSLAGGGLAGISGQAIAQSAGQVAAYTNGYGTAPSLLTSAVAQANSVDDGSFDTGGGLADAGSGAVLSPSAYGLINAQQTGTAQYGYNDLPTPPTPPVDYSIYTGLTPSSLTATYDTPTPPAPPADYSIYTGTAPPAVDYSIYTGSPPPESDAQATQPTVDDDSLTVANASVLC